MANVCWTTDSVEYPATFRQAIPLRSRNSLSRLFVPVAVTQTSFRCFAHPQVCSLTSALLRIRISASLTRSGISSGFVKSYMTTSPKRLKPDKSRSSPSVFLSGNTIFIRPFLGNELADTPCVMQKKQVYYRISRKILNPFHTDDSAKFAEIGSVYPVSRLAVIGCTHSFQKRVKRVRKSLGIKA